MQISQEQRTNRTTSVGESDAYSLFVYAVRSLITRDYYLRRLRIFFNYIDLLPEKTLEERCNLFAAKGIRDPGWAFSCIIKFLQFQKERVEKEEITGATLRRLKLILRTLNLPRRVASPSLGRASGVQKMWSELRIILLFFV